MSGEIQTVERVGTIQAAPPAKIESYLKSPVFAEEARKVLGSLDLANRVARCAVTYIGLLSPDKRKPIMAASPESLVKVVLQLASIGLELGRDADLVPRGGVVTGSIKWEGYVRAARASGLVRRVWGDVIYEGESYTITSGSDGSRVQHAYTLPRSGEIIGAYACAEWTDGTVESEVKDRGYLDRCRKVGGPAWNMWFAEMSVAKLKKLICRRLPLGPPDKPDTAMVLASVDTDAPLDMDGELHETHEEVAADTLPQLPAPENLTTKTRGRKTSAKPAPDKQEIPCEACGTRTPKHLLSKFGECPECDEKRPKDAA